VSIARTLLKDVRRLGVPVTGDSPRALPAALAARGCRTVGPTGLVELAWGDEVPGNDPKSLRVRVPRAGSAGGAPAIVRDGAGIARLARPGRSPSGRSLALAPMASGRGDLGASDQLAGRRVYLSDEFYPPQGGHRAFPCHAEMNT
jgi:hypothetical protein